MLGGQEPCCNFSDSKLIVEADSGYLSSSVAAETGCGTSACPWQIQAPRGQKIDIFLWDFQYRKLQQWIVLKIKYSYYLTLVWILFYADLNTAHLHLLHAWQHTAIDIIRRPLASKIILLKYPYCCILAIFPNVHLICTHAVLARYVVYSWVLRSRPTYNYITHPLPWHAMWHINTGSWRPDVMSL